MTPQSRTQRRARTTAFLLLLTLVGLSRCQQLSPLAGRGTPPEEGVDVYVTCIIDRLLGVNDIDYRFEAMLYFQFSWRDPRAREAVQNATEAATDPAYNGGAGCGFPCTTLYAWRRGAACCDDVFLPHLEFVNARAFSQDRPVRYRVALPEEGDAVVWWSYVFGEWYTPLQFSAFPFDRQYLLVQILYANRTPKIPVRFIPSSTGTELFRPKTGDDFSGWNIKGLDVYPFNFSKYENQLIRSNAATSFSHPDDPWPLNPANSSAAHFESQLWSEGFNVVITVERISLFYLIIAVLPIAINVWLSLLVFFISPKHLDTRLGIVTTFFLALSAIQYVVAATLPSSSSIVPTQQLVLVSYCVLAIIGLASILAYRIVTAEQQRAKRELSRQASFAFNHRWKAFVQGMGSAAAAAVAEADAAAAAASSAGASQAGSGTGNGTAETAEEQQGAGPGRQGLGADGGEFGASASRRQHRGTVSFGDIDSSGSGPLREGRSISRSALLEAPGQGSKRFKGVGLCTGPAGSDAGSDDDRQSYQSSEDPGGSRYHTLGGSQGPAGFSSSSGATLKERHPGGSRRVPGSLPGGPPRWGPAGGAGSGPSRDVEAGAGPQDGGGKYSGRLKGWRQWAMAAGGLCSRPKRWFALQALKLKEMKREAKESKEYAEHIASKMDRAVFWTVLLGYNVSIIVILVVGSQQQATLGIEGG